MNGVPAQTGPKIRAIFVLFFLGALFFVSSHTYFSWRPSEDPSSLFVEIGEFSNLVHQQANIEVLGLTHASQQQYSLYRCAVVEDIYIEHTCMTMQAELQQHGARVRIIFIHSAARVLELLYARRQQQSMSFVGQR